ncbi:Acyl-CoA dehydrogenase [Streptomyces sp. 2224.1]|uniref:acyl-CoA dehydrogenase family protein n=1 Tax=unclassified Streptomyces TaxID=2593676 RepID=UPI00088D3F3C|nr:MULTISPECIES: acyl-CoA dehydrogenase family protein [unclassified Streptomyces]PBC83610.1 alkylation response protein AidB-like acyl-CoA dehydrogenase [Streptomyces sp. 2321.6]SDR40734.1 Acyl-CoA dehydrogenase [Streptomyces sp. KS_16]SEC00617.1 Acyl-CoA dehydrogenase [Streptomyces sp. 2224.1]SED02190.1 Acyl-CoA dehydrogenase [Streptomyces sp. 2133.1]SNC69688.1 Acyl-CoA dehydrogenase [Streptomyces sp. 2114.4]
MDFTFTEEQQAAAEAARAVFAGVAPDGVPSPALTPGAVADDFDRALWRKLADADLLSLPIAPEHGGAGLDPIALCLVLRESAKVLARVPLLEAGAAALILQRYAADELGAHVLPRIAAGELVVTVAGSGRTGHEPAELAVDARQEGADWVFDGVQTAVPWAGTADRILLPAHTPEGHAVLALVPRIHPGVTLDDQISTTGERLAEVRLDSVRLSGQETITDPDAWELLRNVLTTGTCALALGLGERVLAMTGDYTSKREQFGFPVATFQAVAVQAADRFIDLRAMEATLWQAAWRITTDAAGPLPPAGDVAVAKIWASEGVRRVVQTAQHLHGGFGADTDYALHRYHAWAKQLELSLGPAAAHEEALGDLLAAHPLS